MPAEFAGLVGGVCIRSEPRVKDRSGCTFDRDCVPENCMRPTLCVHRADTVCRSTNAGQLDVCVDCIASCRCVDGCCVTRYVDGCC